MLLYSKFFYFLLNSIAKYVANFVRGTSQPDPASPLKVRSIMRSSKWRAQGEMQLR